MRMRLVLAVAAALVLAAPAHAAGVRQGPAGLDFYTPPKTLPKGTHGTPVWARKLTGKAALKGARSNRLVLYRSESPSGHDTAVTGTVAIPRGKAPRGGWPIVTWAHGTTGIADACAPSITGMPLTYDQPLLERWLRAGYAVVRTDYEGLGTPGTHPYLIGVSEGRSVLDMVRAARKLDRSLGRRVVIAGHSQGGHAALWAASLAGRWTPELAIRGTVAFAPASHVSEQAGLFGAVTAKGGLTALAAMIVRGIDVANPELDIPGALLSDAARALYPRVSEVCIGNLAEPDAFGGLSPAELLKPGAVLGPAIAALERNDPETLRIRTPVRIEQGVEDTTVFKLFTDQLVPKLRARGAKVTYKTYSRLDHVSVVTGSGPPGDATRFVRSRLR